MRSAREKTWRFSLTNTPTPVRLFQQALADQVLVGTGDGVRIDDQVLRQGAHGRKLVAHAQAVLDQRETNVLGDLPMDRGVARRLDGKGQRHACIRSFIRYDVKR